MEGDMISSKTIRSGIVALSVILGAGSLALGQQATQPDAQLRTYSQARESSLVGTVIKFDTASSAALPMGAHVLLQTSSGQVDVHLGNAKVLQASHLELNSGDSIRIIGEPIAVGDSTYFAARIVQKGAQAVAVRNTKGFPLKFAPPSTSAQVEALRGVR